MIRKALALTILAAAFAAAGAEEPPDGPACVLVSVRGPDGEPVESGVARLYPAPLREPRGRRVRGGYLPPDEPLDALRTAPVSEGEASFSGLAPGRYRVVAVAPGLSRADAGVAFEPGLPPARVRLDLFPAGRLEGRVLLHGERPLPQVRVLVAAPGTWNAPCPPTRVFQAVSDEEGRYRVEGLPPGFHEVWTRRPDGPWVRGVRLHFPAVDHLDLRVTDGAVLTGLVTAGSTGEPVAGAEVALRDGRYGDEVLCRTRTGEDGRYRIRTDLAAARGLGLLVSAPTLARREVESDRLKYLREGQVVDLDVALDPECAISGTLTGPDGPVADATVIVWRPTGHDDDLTKTMTRTDAAGRYRAGGLAAGPHWVEVEAPGLHHAVWGRPYVGGGRDTRQAPVEARVDLSPREEATLDVRLAVAPSGKPELSVTGVVRGLDGEPLPLVTVVATGGEPVLTGPDGTFRVRANVRPDDTWVEVRASRPGFDEARAWTPLTDPDARTGVVLGLRRQPVLHGRVVSTLGRPVAGAEVLIGTRAWARNMGEVTDWDFVPGGRAGPDGSFELRLPSYEGIHRAEASFGGGPLNGFVVAVRAPGHGPAISAPFRAEPRRTESRVEVPVGAGCGIAGRVVDAETGEPLPGIPIAIDSPRDLWTDSSWPPRRLPGPWRLVTAVTDAAGRFRIGDLAPGPHRLVVEEPGFASVEREVEVPAEGPVELSLGPWVALTGVVTRSDGHPVASAEVWLLDEKREQGPATWGHRVHTDTFGRFRFEDVIPGRYVACARTHHAPLGQGLSEPVAAGDEDARIVLPPGLEIKGRVTDLEGEPAGWYQVVARSREPGVAEVEAEEEDDDRYVLAGLRPGRWDLEFEGEGFRVTVPGVPAGEDRDLAFGGDLSISGRISPREFAVLGDTREVTLAAVPVDPPAPPGATVRFTTWIEREEGTFEFRGLAPGEYRITGGFHAGFKGEARDFEVRGDLRAQAGAKDVEVRLSFAD